MEESEEIYIIEKNTEGSGWVPIAKVAGQKSALAMARRIQYGDAEGEIISFFRVVSETGEVIWEE